MNSKSLQTWSLIVVAYNESASILSVVDGIHAAMTRLSAPDYEIVVVDDGSTDGTTEILRTQLETQPHVRVVYHGTNKGIGEALRSGYYAAQMENVITLPGDGQFDIEEIYPFANLDNHTVVSFTRDLSSMRETYTPYRRLLSRANRVVNRILLGCEIKDVNWVKLFKRDDLVKCFDLSLRSSIVLSEVCAKLVYLGCSIVEPPSRYLPRVGGKPRGASLKIVSMAAKEVFALAVELQRFKLANPRHERKLHDAR